MKQMTPVKWLGVIILIIIVGLIGCYIFHPLTVAVTGYGEVEAPADSAVIAFTIADVNQSPAQVQMNIMNKAQEMKQVLVDNGFKAEEVILSVPTVEVGQGGYQATMSLGGTTDRVQDMSVLNALLYERGAVYVAQPILSTKETAQWQSAAMDLALADANLKVSKIAADKHKLFKRLVGIMESDNSQVQATTLTQSAIPVQQQEGQVLVAQDTIKVSRAVVTTYKLW